MKIADIRGRRSPRAADLQTYRENGAVAQTGNCVGWRCVENFPRLNFRNAAVLPSMRLIVGRSTSNATTPWRTRCLNKLDSAARRRRTVECFAPSLFALHPLPGDDGAMMDLAQFVGAGNAERAYEMAHVEPVGTAGLWTLLLRQPHFFFGDGGELVERGELAAGGCDGQGGH